MNEVLMQETKTEDPAVTEQEEAPRKKRFHLPKGKKGRKWMRILVVLAVEGMAYLITWKAGKRRVS